MQGATVEGTPMIEKRQCPKCGLTLDVNRQEAVVITPAHVKADPTDFRATCANRKDQLAKLVPAVDVFVSVAQCPDALELVGSQLERRSRIEPQP